MNRQEIQKTINELHRMKNRLTGAQGCSVHHEEANVYSAMCLSIAIFSLEKQIPKKPIEEQGISPRCPYCDNANYLTNEDEKDNNCCGNCGQAIDWEGEDE